LPDEPPFMILLENIVQRMRLQTLAAVIVILASWLLAATGNALMEKEAALCGIVETSERLRRHLMELTVKIGERSVYFPENLLNAAEYIETSYRAMGLEVERQEYSYADMTAVNIVSSIDFSEKPTRTYVLGAHYDSVDGTVGADDNASAIAVQIETARRLVQLREKGKMNLRVVFVSFALEEPPVFSTAFMGSRIFARRLRETKTDIEGMICLEMVGYTCDIPGCQGYPLPFFFRNYPDTGNFIGIVGNFKSRGFTSSLMKAFASNPRLPAMSLTVPFNGWILPAVRLSDHASFWDMGYKAVMVTDTAFFRNPHYHLASDTMETLDYHFMASLVDSLVIFFEGI